MTDLKWCRCGKRIVSRHPHCEECYDCWFEKRRPPPLRCGKIRGDKCINGNAIAIERSEIQYNGQRITEGVRLWVS